MKCICIILHTQISHQITNPQIKVVNFSFFFFLCIKFNWMSYILQGPFTPKRYYSIDRVFRNEAVDRTHLAEFHQIEGYIFGYVQFHV